MLELYDLEEIFVCQNAMGNRGIKEEYLLIDVDSISNKDINEKLSQCDQIMVF